MPTQHFTTGQAAEYLEMPRETLRAWMHKGWLDAMLPAKEYTGKWTHFTPGEVVLLRLVNEFSRFMKVQEAVSVAANCQPAVMQFLFEGKQRFRFVGVRITQSDGKNTYTAHFDESLAKFQSEDVFGYFVIDLAAIPIPGTEKESAQ